jgi:hypothetical protein
MESYESKPEMKTIIKSLSALKNPYKFSRHQVTIFAIIFSLVGVIVLYKSFATGPFISLEPENGTLNGSATIGTDSAASGGKYVQFGTSAIGNSNCAAVIPTDFTKLTFCDDLITAAGTAPDTTKWVVYGGLYETGGLDPSLQLPASSATNKAALKPVVRFLANPALVYGLPGGKIAPAGLQAVNRYTRNHE